MTIAKEHYLVPGVVLFVRLMKTNLGINAESKNVKMADFLAVKPVNCINKKG